MTATVSTFPSYEVPAFVAERFPSFDPTDPSTWPEPDRCSDGRPWGHSAYGDGLGRDTPALVADRWRRYLAAVDAEARSTTRTRHRPHDLGCRNRWRSEEFRLCGTHLAPFLRARLDRSRRARAQQRHEQHLDLAKRLGAYGIEATGQASGVLLQADAVEGVLRLLEGRS